MRECPICGQQINAALAICPYCAARLTSPSQSKPPKSAADRRLLRDDQPAAGEGRLYTPLPLDERPAGFGIRLLAAAMDSAAVCMAAAALGLIAFFLMQTAGGRGLYGQVARAICGGLFLGFCFYNNILLPGTRGSSLGKRLCGLRIVNEGGAFLGSGRMLVREIAKTVSLVPLALGFLWVLWDPRKQAWHDKLVGSYVRIE